MFAAENSRKQESGGMTTTPGPTVPLSEFGVHQMTTAELDAWAELAGVTVVRDYLDRAACSLADAYRLGEQRRQAALEWDEAQSRRHIEHAAAVKDLEKRCNAAYAQARDAFMANSGKSSYFSGAELRGEAVNAGLDAARAIWMAAPDLIRQEITTVEAVEHDEVTMYDLGVKMPREVIDHYVRALARKS